MNKEVLDIKVLAETQVPDTDAIPLLDEIRFLAKHEKIKIVVLDDDPTGTQTVYDIPVITSWQESLITDTLQNADRGFFILTNTRSLPEEEAIAINIIISQRVKAASVICGCSVLLISRSDSTLRGHFPAELFALENGWGAPWDGYVLMPFFKEGGRFTIANVHYVREGNQLVPASATSYARDPSFGYSSSDLTQYIKEKTNQQVDTSKIVPVTLEQLNAGPAAVTRQLDKMYSGKYAVVNATCSCHAAVFALAFLRKWQSGERYLVRCSASLVQSFFGITDSKLLSATAIVNNTFNGGLIVAGSFVNQTTLQLKHLLANTNIIGIEINVRQLLHENTFQYIREIAELLNAHLKTGVSVILYTSRKLLNNAKGGSFLEAGNIVSEALVAIVKLLTCRPKFLAAKGGITSSVIATHALGVEKAIVLGQLMPGVPVWNLGAESKFPGMAYIIIPGNVGTEEALTKLYNKLENAAA